MPDIGKNGGNAQDGQEGIMRDFIDDDARASEVPRILLTRRSTLPPEPDERGCPG